MTERGRRQRLHRFLVAALPSPGLEVPLERELAHQLLRVLRLRAGDRMLLFDGSGLEAEAELLLHGTEVAAARVLRHSRPEVEVVHPLHLGVAVLKGEKLEWTLQKLTELGATRISLLLTERTIVDAGEGRWSRREQRLQRVIQEAAEQCGRVRLPVLEPPLPLAQALSGREEQAWILHPGEPLLTPLSPPAPVSLFVGPEGGFTSHEVELARELGVAAAGLGPRTLRAETAALAAAALLALADTPSAGVTPPGAPDA